MKVSEIYDCIQVKLTSRKRTEIDILSESPGNTNNSEKVGVMPGYQNHIQIREKNFDSNMNNVNYLVNSDLFIFILISYALVNILYSILYKLTLYIYHIGNVYFQIN